MGSKPLTIRERLAVVETKLKYVKDSVDHCTKTLRESNNKLVKIEQAINSKLSGSLSTREKTSIYVSLIVSVTSIVVAYLSFLKP